MNFGISTSCFYPAYLELAVEDLVRHGVQNIEIFVNTYSEMRPAYLRTLKQELDANKIRVVSVHPAPASGYAGKQGAFHCKC